MVKDRAEGKGRFPDAIRAVRKEKAELESLLRECRRLLQESCRERETLQLHMDRFAAIVDNADDEIVQLDLHGTLILVNKKAEEMFGYQREELIGHSFLDLPPFDQFRGRQREELFRSFLAIMEQEHPPLLEWELVRKDGSALPVEASARPLKRDGQVQGAVFVIRDISKRKKAEERLQELYNEERRLRQHIEAEMKNTVEFTRALAHELKTPLTPILASIDTLAGELHDRRLIGLARNVAQGALTLDKRIDELLDLVRGEVGMLRLKTESVDLLPMLRAAADSMAPLASASGQSLVVHLPSSVPRVRADVARLEQVMTNLLGNAIKFTPRGGEITMAARGRGSSLVVEVKDTGPGMSKRQQEVVFEPYHRLERTNERVGGLGLGLGLALCKMFIELHGGQIWARSRPGKGSVFGFSLPVEGGFQPAASLEGMGKLWKILIVEDDVANVKSLLFALEAELSQASVITTRMGAEALDLVEAEHPDVVILDLGLPDMDGLEVLQQIRAFSAVPVIVLTVRQEEQDTSRALGLGADDYMTKPFRTKELLARLNVQLRRQTRSGDDGPLVYGPLRLDPSSFELTCGSKEINLTVIEGNILKQLMMNAGHVVSHERLAETVWEEDYPGAIAGLRTYIRQLRRKIEVDPSHPTVILTKVGIGYSLGKFR